MSRDKDYEVFKLYPEKDPNKHILVQGNRPMLRAKGLKHKRITRKVNSDVRYPTNLDKAIKLIERHLEPNIDYKIPIRCLLIIKDNRTEKRKVQEDQT